MVFTTTFWCMMLAPIAATLMVVWCVRQQSVDLPWYMRWLVLPLPGFGIVVALFAVSYHDAVTDELVVNGQITGKRREQKHERVEQKCDCYKDRTTGREQCHKCYEDRYEVVWWAESTIGSLWIDHEVSDRPTVYNTHDPERYVQLRVGEPVADRRTYVNYLQAARGMISASPAWGAASTQTTQGMPLPAYPMPLRGAYSVDHFLTVGLTVPDAREWNRDIALLLRELGPTKQVNLIVVAVNNQEPSYTRALWDHWEGGNKNDVVLLLGTPDGRSLRWASVLTWANTGQFSESLRAAVMQLGVIERERLLAVVADAITRRFERRHMSEFESLKSQIEPSGGVMAMALLLLCLSYGLAAFVIVRKWSD